MNPFEITIEGTILTIEPQKDGSYFVFEAGIKIGDVYSDQRREGTVWQSSDLITKEQTQKIGQAIENHDV